MLERKTQSLRLYLDELVLPELSKGIEKIVNLRHSQDNINFNPIQEMINYLDSIKHKYENRK